ncbi:mRNA turnover and ribosome assembly protein [Brettanomyces nanus]|uniref:Ribosome assembly factor mrt4 n=1 Tax=Eeniella nana TaxID=13502 RepID=A0A875S0K0_EENNA|nr:mRNA turnover and ribosome assembly protein [Brettanomyces nanus]QPG73642.1 mRNA turnover and ribosome assembly protein [Brettanomyces nanus]
MPRSKRSKLVTLAQTDKKGRESKVKLFDDVRKSLDSHRYTWALQMDDVRTPVLQDIRRDWSGSKLIMGKKKVLHKAFGETREEEYKENLHKLVGYDQGFVGYLFTDESPETVDSYFRSYVKNDYARANNRSPITFIVPEGTLYSRAGQISIEDDVPMQHTMEPTLRNKFQMPTKIVKGKITLTEPFKVVNEGDVLSVKQAVIMKTFGVAAAEFKVKILAYHDNTTGEVKEVDGKKKEIKKKQINNEKKQNEEPMETAA